MMEGISKSQAPLSGEAGRDTGLRRGPAPRPLDAHETEGSNLTCLQKFGPRIAGKFEN